MGDLSGDLASTGSGTAMLARTMNDKTAVVAAIPMFAKLEPRSLEAIATLAKTITVPAETVLLREGEPAGSFYVIVDGTVRIKHGHCGGEDTADEG